MPEDQLAPNVQSLIARHISSIDHVSMVVALVAKNGIPTRARALAEAVSVAEPAAEAALRDFLKSGLVAESKAGFVISRDESDLEAARRLAEIYNQNPIAVIRAIYERPVSSATSFAEAFRIRRNTE